MNTILAIIGAIILTAGVAKLTSILIRASVIPLFTKHKDLDESYLNLYMQLGEAYKELDAYKRMFGPIEDWQNKDMNRQFQNYLLSKDEKEEEDDLPF